MRLVAVPKEQVDEVWPLVERQIEAACRRGPENDSAARMRERCASGEYQLWLAREGEVIGGAAITGFLKEQNRKVCLWLAVAGSGMAAWHKLQAIIEDVARAHGCTAMRSYSRPGMVKRMNDYSLKGLILEKAI